MKIRLVLAVVLAMTLAGCGLIQTSESSDTSDPPDESGVGLGDLFSGLTNTGPQWSDYVPMEDGRVCTYSGTETFDGSDAAEMGFDEEVVAQIPTTEDTTTETVEFLDARRESGGTRLTEETSTEKTSIFIYDDGRTEENLDEYDEPTPPVRLEYVLANDGTFRHKPVEFAIFDQLSPDVSYEVGDDDFITFPALGDLREGESRSGTATALVRGTNPEAQAELEEDLAPGESEREMRMEYTVESLPPEEISTPAGTFTDVVGVAVTSGAIEFPNDSEEGSTWGEVLESKVTYWYARDVGLVMRDVSISESDAAGGGFSESYPTAALEGCSEAESNIEPFAGEWLTISGRSRMVIEPDSTGTVYGDAWYRIEPDDSAATRGVRRVGFDLSEASTRGATATITAVEVETGDGGTPADVDPGDEPEPGDTFRLNFVEGDALQTTWMNRPDDFSYGIHGGRWCNPEISDMHAPECIP